MLLDTHTFIWFLNGDDALPEIVLNKIEEIENRCFISIVSIWEIAIKVRLNKLVLASTLESLYGFLLQARIEILPISIDHIIALNTLELYHKDPFDRLIIAQSMCESLTILSKDKHFKLYPAKIFWQ